ncbi:cytochrome P450 [Streptomyces sp. NPDC007896]|uniref:cytochrome P450 n=1 Tax=Streptomyces TaxID=1883 RepID=UPI0036E147D4
MSDTTTSAGENSAEIPAFPMSKNTAACPFDPAPALYTQRQEGPLTRVRLWNGSTPWLVTGYNDQRSVLADPRVSANLNTPGFPSTSPPVAAAKTSLFRMDDPEHARLRRMITAPFAIKRVNAMRPAVQKIVDDQIDAMLAGPKPVDLVEAFALPVPSVVISELLGVPYDAHEFFQDNSQIMASRNSTPEQKSGAVRTLIEYLHGLISEKVSNPGDDLLSGLAEPIKTGELTQQEAAGLGILLLAAGHETTANMIALGTLALLQHPDQLALLRESEDPKVVTSAVEELLRYLNIAHDGRLRAATEDFEVAGQIIHAGEGLIMPNEIGNRDPEIFDDPDRLDITRDARRHVAFGFGVHQCLGQSLARVELQIVYSTLYKRIPTLKLATELDQIPFKDDGIIYGVYKLPVTW